MRRWSLGLPLAGGPPVAHRPAAYWLGLFSLSHDLGDGAPRLRAWPDGGPLLAQPWHLARIFATIAAELAAAREARLRKGAAAENHRDGGAEQ